MAAWGKPISEGLKPEVLKGLLEDREVMSQAALDEAPGGLSRYGFTTAVLIHASRKATYGALTDYSLYAKMIPYIQRADFDKNSHILKLEGGLWGFNLISQIRFDETPDRVGYEFVGGHFRGLKGEMLFEDRGEKGTLVLLRGEQLGKEFPPKFLITRGAEIVFGFTARRMRSYVESLGHSMEGASNGNEFPQPRRHLPKSE